MHGGFAAMSSSRIDGMNRMFGEALARTRGLEIGPPNVLDKRLGTENLHDAIHFDARRR